MDRFQRDALDRHITGNWGEDQFRDADEALERDEREAAERVDEAEEALKRDEREVRAQAIFEIDNWADDDD